MIDAAREVFVLYDPLEQYDAMHAALFTKPHVTKLRLRHMGDAIQTDLLNMDLLHGLIVRASEERLTESSFARIYRARRNYAPYLRRMMTSLDIEGRERLVYYLATNVTARMKAPRFQRRLSEMTRDYS